MNTNKQTRITEEFFLNSEVSQISETYYGKADYCYSYYSKYFGKYIDTSFMFNPKNKVDDKLVERRLKRAKLLVKQGAEVEYGTVHVTVKNKYNKAFVFYFDEFLIMNEFRSIETIIDSCKSIEEIQSVENMIETFKNKWIENRWTRKKFKNIILSFSMTLKRKTLEKIKSLQS